MKQEKQVKSYTRRTKSGKTVTVKAHTAKYDAADKKDAAKKKGAGKEIEDLKSKKKATTFEVGFDDFKEWYNETGSKGDKRVAKALHKQLGSSGYQKFRNFVDDNYSSRGHWEMFKRVKGITNKSLDEMTTLKGPRRVSPKKKVLQKDSKKSTPSKIDVGKSAMNLPTKKIPTYPVKSKWGRMSARQIKDAKSIMEQNGVSQKEAIKSVMSHKPQER